MKNNRGNKRAKKARKKKLWNRVLRHWGFYFILLMTVVVVFLQLYINRSKPLNDSDYGVESEELDYEEDVITTPYYNQEAGVIESILTETDQTVYSIHYPRFSQTDIDEDIDTLVNQMLQEAEKDHTPVNSLEERGMFYMNYDSYLVGHNIVSIVFYFECNRIDLANPETFMISRHYNLDSGEVLEYEDLFKPGYLEAIASYCKEHFSKLERFEYLLEDECYDEYFTAKKENYQNLSLTSEGVVVTFPKDLVFSKYKEYQITIPYDTIAEYLKFDYESDIIVIEEKEENIVYESQTPVIDPDKPMIALTFDDGPSSSGTSRILDVLQEYDSRATFFVVGNRLRNYPELLQRIVKEGSEIGSHTYNHKSLSLLTEKQIKKELAAVDDHLVELLGQDATTLRPPYGAVNDVVRKAVDKPMIYWSVDTEDWKSRNTKEIVNNVIGKVKDGDIVLFHDLYDSTAAAIEIIVPKLIEEGYQLVTVSELFEYKGITLEGGNVYYHAR